MSWLIVGTVPRTDHGLTWGGFVRGGRRLQVDGRDVPVARGTPALLATAALAAEVLGIGQPQALLVGDTGRGEGSRALYARLTERAAQVVQQGVTFHYLMPDVAWHNKILWALESLPRPPLLVADAGFMYAAKMSGYAAHYDLFTPDAGEMAFLADEKAPHPFYTRGFFLQEDGRIPELVRLAHAGENAARHLLVKGRTDYVVAGDEIRAEINAPDTPALEPIGGTGDTLTGLVTAFLAARLEMDTACRVAALTNRYMGLFADPTPACGIADLLPFLPQALERAMREVGL